MKRWRLPLGLEIAGAILLALVVSNFATMVLFRVSGQQEFTRFAADFQAQRIAGVMNVVFNAPDPMKQALAAQLSTPGLLLSTDAQPLVEEEMSRDARVEQSLALRLEAGRSSGLRAHVLSIIERTQFATNTTPDVGLFVSAPLSDGRWLNVRFGMDPPYPPIWPVVAAVSSALVALLLASFWTARRVARPLQRLADAARALRRGEVRGAVPVNGPMPVQEAALAFNAMSERVTTTLNSQKALMAAVAHDLRTPIAALRFRVEAVSDEETRSKLLETIAEMQAMTEAVLDAVRVEGSGEPTRPVDAAVLAESLCADMTELGGDIAFAASDALVCSCRPAELRRALRNLIENALRYGVRAAVRAERVDGLAAIHIDDEGPGIPEEKLERVFEPFARLEESRNASTGGYGLGLAIARLIARSHGGDVTLKNRDGGGLRATLTLPLG
jgi:signal transduction histidine kinase